MIGVLLAAGASSRMGEPKALVMSRGQSFLVRGVRALWTSCDSVITVVGHQGEQVCEAAGEEFERLVERGLLAPERPAVKKGRKSSASELEVRFAFNKRWPDGMLSSAKVGLAAALKSEPRGILLMPVDQPEVKGETVQALAAMLAEALGAFGGKAGSTFAYGLVPRWKGQRGHPVAMSTGLAAGIVKDRGARDLSDAIRRSARLIGYIDVTDKGVVANLNTPEGVRGATKTKPRAR